jgi:hypothetical protein
MSRRFSAPSELPEAFVPSDSNRLTTDIEPVITIVVATRILNRYFTPSATIFDTNTISAHW